MGSTILRFNAAKLAELRFRAGYTQAGLAAKVPGVARNYIRRVEAGDFTPTPARVAAMAAALGVSLDDLIDRVAA
jgi:transcriptional regulator with XRE-family HTH domain